MVLRKKKEIYYDPIGTHLHFTRKEINLRLKQFIKIIILAFSIYAENTSLLRNTVDFMRKID